MSYLLDVNILIALLDENHYFHQSASVWFHSGGKHAWASCPITENGVARVMSHAKYPNRPGEPQNVMALLEELKTEGNHVFWPDDISLANPDVFNLRQARRSSDLTDIYLLGLARSKGGKLATLDGRIRHDAVIGGRDALEIITGPANPIPPPP